MGSVLIIKNADFSENALGTVDIEGLTPSWMGKELCLPQVANGVNVAGTKKFLYSRVNRAAIVINSSDASSIYSFSETGSVTGNPMPNQDDYSYLTIPYIADKVIIGITNTDYLMFVEANYQNEINVVAMSDWARNAVLDVSERNSHKLYLSITIKRSNDFDIPSNLTLSDLGFSISFG